MAIANIQLTNFKYRKSTGATSSRNVVIIEEDSNRILGFEVNDGDLTDVQQYLAYQAELEDIKEHLKAKYGIDNKTLPFKSFLSKGITGRVDTNLRIDL